MYEELVKELRQKHRAYVLTDNAKPGQLFADTADAIEKLNEAVDQQARILEKYGGETGINDLKMFAEKYWELLEKTPRWIPTTERLPEKDGLYFAMGRNRNYSTECWVCQFANLGGMVKGWINDASRPVVEAWMEIPAPPKSLRKPL